MPGKPGAAEEGGGYHMSYRDAKKKELEDFERDFIAHALRRHQGDVTAASEELGIKFSYLYKIMRKYKL